MKKFFAALLAALMVLSLVHIPAATSRVKAEGEAVFAAATVSDVNPGDTVDVPVTLTAGNAFEAHTLNMYVQYDPAKLTLNSATIGAAASGATLPLLDTTEEGKVKLGLLYVSAGMTAGGELFTMNFTVANDVTENIELPVVVEEFNNVPVGGEATPIPFTTVNGLIQLTTAGPDLDEALNIEGGTLHFENDATYPWEIIEEGERIYAKSTNIGVASSIAKITFTYTATADEALSFDFISMGEGSDSYDWDGLRLYVDGSLAAKWGANHSEWETYTYDFEEAGEHTIELCYKKDSSVNGTGDYACVDNVAIVAGLIPPETEVPPTEVPPTEVPPTEVPPTEVPPTEVPPTEAPVGDLDEALNVEGGTLHFETSDTYPWIVVTEGERMYAKSSNEGVSSSTSVLITTVTVEAGDCIVFEFKAWGEGTGGEVGVTVWDKCEFSVDDELIMKVGALQNDWSFYGYEFAEAGEHELRWQYAKDGSVNPTGDYFAVDNVEITDEIPETPVIHEVELNNFVVPEWMETPNFNITVPTDAHYYVSQTVWVKGHDSDELFLTGDDVFDDGTAPYWMGIVLVPEEGYQFDNPPYNGPVPTELAVTLNGSTEYISNVELTDAGTLLVTTIDFYVIDPSNPMLVGYYFETDPEAEGWQFIDDDGDGYTWRWLMYGVNYSYESAYEGLGLLSSASYGGSTVGALNPDNWAISPEVTIPAGDT
ncbi:MAG: hypothetical protein IK064_02585, partial [Clostridia bacterium]|nr:hypothetical protein [Clostridia bacterium]